MSEVLLSVKIRDNLMEIIWAYTESLSLFLS